MEHKLKTWPVYFWDVVSGAKTFEVRRDDRGIQTGDTLVLQEWDPNLMDYTGEEIRVRVNYLVSFNGLPSIPNGLIGMSIEGGC